MREPSWPRGASISTREARSPRASFSIASTSSGATPGSARMSTSMSMRSGMTLIFDPPCTTLGENVVWVQACARRANPSGSRCAHRLQHAVGIDQRRLELGRQLELGRRSGATRRGCAPSGWYSARRRTTSAAVTSALSVRNGIEPWPGVPRTTSRRQLTPFSPTVTGSFGPDLVGIGTPPLSVMT